MSENLLEIVLLQLLLAGNWASALHIGLQVEHILGEGQRGPNWK